MNINAIANKCTNFICQLISDFENDRAEIQRNKLITNLMKMHYAPLYIAGLNTSEFRIYIKKAASEMNDRDFIDNFLQMAYEYFFKTQREEIKQKFDKESAFLYDCLNYQQKRNTFENFCDSYVDKTDELISNCYQEVKREQEKQIFESILNMPNGPEKQAFSKIMYGQTKEKPNNSIDIHLHW